MIPFEENSAPRSVIDEIFRGMVGGGALGNVMQGEALDVEEDYAWKAGEIAYNSTDGQIAPALLAMVINARLGGSTADVFESLEKHGVEKSDIESLLYHDKKLISYRALWTPATAQTLIGQFPAMSPTAQTAILAHIMTLFIRFDDPSGPAPQSVRDAVMDLSRRLLPYAHPSSLTEMLADKITPSDVRRDVPGKKLDS